ncbi:zf-HC2 domain-containing protein [Actinomycetospora atypica]|uniref:Zf-HC2 domain-containing protein n=1 Tax=Actinomycetospora atypica TaxID=1290095 RepID=A0ABV9YSW6_9PSEU
MSAVGDPHDGELAGAVVGRALRALEPEDEDRVDEHLRGCAACRALLAQTHETMAALARSVPPVEPPPGLRSRILEAAAAEPVPPRAAPVPTPAGGTVPTRPAATASPVPGGPAVARVPRRRTAALLALVAVVAGVVVFSARAAVQDGGGDPRSVAAARAQQVVESAEARDPGVRHASLVQPGGSVMAVVLDDTTGARVVPVDVPDLGAGRTFVLWRVVGGGATAVGTFDGSGTYTPVGTTTAPPGGGAPTLSQGAYAVSAEPLGPVPARPSAVVASGRLI